MSNSPFWEIWGEWPLLRIISKIFLSQEKVKLSIALFYTFYKALFILVCNRKEKTLADIIKDAKILSKRLARTIFF